MLTANNQILNTSAVATHSQENGIWRDVNNWTAFSIHLKNLEGNVWVEVANDPACKTDATIAGVPVTGNLASKVANPADNTDQADTAFSADGSQCMWSPACLVWNFVRVCKDPSVQTKSTTAYLFGQQA